MCPCIKEALMRINVQSFSNSYLYTCFDTENEYIPTYHKENLVFNCVQKTPIKF